MSDENETITIEMNPDGRLRLYGQITAQMEKLGLNPCDYRQLKLGFELAANWPVDINAQPTLAQLTVVAVKLKMRIIIDNLTLMPRKETDDDEY